MIKKVSKKRVKQAMFTMLAAVMLSGPVLQNSTLLAQAAYNSNANLNTQVNNGHNGDFNDFNSFEYMNDNGEFEAMIAELEQFIHVEDGRFVFDSVPFNVQAKYGFDLVQAIFEGAESLNDQADEGRFKILDDLNVIDLNASPASRNNINRTIQHWWGVEQWMNTLRAEQFANAMVNVSNAYAGAAILGKFIPGVPIIGGVAAIWYRNMGSNVRSRNTQSKGRGVVVNLHWGFTYTTRVQ